MAEISRKSVRRHPAWTRDGEDGSDELAEARHGGDDFVNHVGAGMLAVFTLATIPSYLPYEKNMRVSVSIDGAEPVICQMKEDYNSKEWKMNHWRGQALKSFYVTLLDGYHTVEIKALDDNIIVDQWVLDFDVDREYYVFPVTR